VAKWPELLHRVISIRTLAFPAMVLYGFIVNPTTEYGGIPCLWRLIFDIQCFGCGLSRADALFIRGHVGQAIEMNWLIVPIYVVAVYYFVAACKKQIRLRRNSWHN